MEEQKGLEKHVEQRCASFLQLSQPKPAETLGLDNENHSEMSNQEQVTSINGRERAEQVDRNSQPHKVSLYLFYPHISTKGHLKTFPFKKRMLPEIQSF